MMIYPWPILSENALKKVKNSGPSTRAIILCAYVWVETCICKRFIQYLINVWWPLLLKRQLVCFHLTGFIGCLLEWIRMFALKHFSLSKNYTAPILIVLDAHLENSIILCRCRIFNSLRIGNWIKAMTIESNEIIDISGISTYLNNCHWIIRNSSKWQFSFAVGNWLVPNIFSNCAKLVLVRLIFVTDNLFLINLNWYQIDLSLSFHLCCILSLFIIKCSPHQLD